MKSKKNYYYFLIIQRQKKFSRFYYGNVLKIHIFFTFIFKGFLSFIFIFIFIFTYLKLKDIIT